MLREDRSYLSSLDNLAIEKGIAQLGIHSIRISRRAYTEAEKEENVKDSNVMSREEWNIRCDKIKETISLKIESLIKFLSTKFNIYQYEDKISYTSDWDLFFGVILIMEIEIYLMLHYHLIQIEI
jgi:hypothetical protein